MPVLYRSKWGEYELHNFVHLAMGHLYFLLGFFASPECCGALGGG